MGNEKKHFFYHWFATGILASTTMSCDSSIPENRALIAKAAQTSGSGYSYNDSTFKLLVGSSVEITPSSFPGETFDSVKASPSLPVGLSVGTNGKITGTPTAASPETTYVLTASNAKSIYAGNVKIRVSNPLAVTATVTPRSETEAVVGWTPSSASGVDGYRVELKMADGSNQATYVNSDATSTTISGLAAGSIFTARVRALQSNTSDPGDISDPSTFGWTPFGAINADSVNVVPQEPWKPSGIEGGTFSENFSIVWSFYWNPGFTPVWKGVPSKDQKGDFYFNTAMNRAYQNTNGLLWGDTGSRDDVVQLWSNGVDKFIVGTYRGRVHLWDRLPNDPNAIAHSREIGLGSTNQSTFSGAAGVCYDASVNKLYVSNAGRNRVLVFNGWPTTSNPDAALVLGQADFNTFTAATTATGMNGPFNLSCDGGILAVADTGNNRILVWTKPITGNNQAADFIYGQSNATSGGANGAGGVAVGGAAHFRSVLLVPRASSGYSLLAADTTQNRVIEWFLIPPTPASQTFPGAFNRVYGQPNSSTIEANYDQQSLSSMAGPLGLSHERDKNGNIKKDIFWVGDGAYWTTHNSRYLKFQRGNTTAIDLWGNTDGYTSLSGWTYPKDRVGFWWSNYVNFSRIGCLGSQGIYNLGGYIWKKAPSNGVTPSDFSDGTRCHTATAGGKTWVANGASIWGVDATSGVNVPSPITGSPILLGRLLADGTANAAVADSYEYKIGGVGDMANIGNKLLVSDGSRIVIWNTSGIANHGMVTNVIGQPSKTTNAANQGGLSASTINYAYSMVVYQGKIIVADAPNNRILIWNTLPTGDGQAADVILGQASGTTNTSGTGLNGMNMPMSAEVINGKLVVADRGNFRVLVWNSIPTTTGAPASKSTDLRDYRFQLPQWVNPNALTPVNIRAFGDKVYVEQYGRVLVIPDIF